MVKHIASHQKTAIEMNTLNTCIAINVWFQEEYEELITKLESYSADLLDHVYSDEEMTHLVNRATKNLTQTHEDKPPKSLARVKLAIHHKQKKVKNIRGESSPSRLIFTAKFHRHFLFGFRKKDLTWR